VYLHSDDGGNVSYELVTVNLRNLKKKKTEVVVVIVVVVVVLVYAE
jgi:hypothetical protein